MGDIHIVYLLSRRFGFFCFDSIVLLLIIKFCTLMQNASIGIIVDAISYKYIYLLFVYFFYPAIPIYFILQFYSNVFILVDPRDKAQVEGLLQSFGKFCLSVRRNPLMLNGKGHLRESMHNFEVYWIQRNSGHVRNSSAQWYKSVQLLVI